jgi:2-polyprenyl-3-methyl-5-hydroxy-6-metoxy-1,4-benzoquinol methylase
MIREKMNARIMEIGMRAFSNFGYLTSRKVEYDFARSRIPVAKVKILDVGSSGSLFAYDLAKSGYQVTSLDVRGYHEKHKNLTTCREDAKKTSIPDATFDIIICISTIEHIGLAAYGDPEYENGDRIVLNEFRRIIKPDGRLILTTPFSGKYEVVPWKRSTERLYDYDRLRRLFIGWEILEEAFYIPQKVKHWVKASRSDAEVKHDAYPISNLSCFVLRPR